MLIITRKQIRQQLQLKIKELQDKCPQQPPAWIKAHATSTIIEQIEIELMHMLDGN